MAVHQCFVQNNSGSFVRVVIASQFGQTGLVIPAGGISSLFLQDGVKTLSTFDFAGNVISLFPIFVGGSQLFQVLPSGVTVPTTVSGSAPAPSITATPVTGGGTI